MLDCTSYSEQRQHTEMDLPMGNDGVSLYTLAYEAASKDDVYLTDAEEAKRRIQLKLEPIFKRHAQEDGQIDTAGLRSCLPELGLRPSDKHISSFLTALDEDDDQKVSIEEMSNFLFRIVMRYLRKPASQASHNQIGQQDKDGKEPEEENEDEEEEEFDLPQDIATLPKEERQAAILKSSLQMIVVGTIAVVLVSDPVCAVMSELGKRMSISPFFVSFVLAPIASNGSELVAAYTLASRKTVAKATAGVSTLIGAGTMNNTLCLGVFFALIFFRGLKWTFTAETISILVVEIVCALIGLKTTQTMADGIIIASMFPLSIALVATLEAVGLQ